jgi:probable H4MPT-linked C1 transfer pathway protein
MINIIGWDIGGANTKAAWVAFERGQVSNVRTASRPYEIWRDKKQLSPLLRDMLAQVTSTPPQAMALTMTAELSDIFRSKREGVLFVLESVAAAFPGLPVYALCLTGEFIPLAEARTRPLDLAAANWLATALFVAEQYGDGLLVDIGSTTTDIIPIQNGRVACLGRTDLDRLLAGELVYTGLLRTHLAAIVHHVPMRGRSCPVSAEYFAISGDVHLILGHIQPADYTCPTPDGRPATVEYARERLARLVCADLEMLSTVEVDEMANAIYHQQVQQIQEAVQQVLSRLPLHRELPLVAMGGGAFLAVQVGQRLGLEVVDWAAHWGHEVSEVAPCLAAAHLLAEQLEAGSH